MPDILRADVGLPVERRRLVGQPGPAGAHLGAHQALGDCRWWSPAVIAIPPAVVLGHVRRGGLLAVSVVNIGRAIPTFAIIVLILPFSLRWGFGLGSGPPLVALVLLAIPPIFTNTYTGVRDVPPEAVEAARGMGMRAGELVRTVEVPVAWPLIITGLAGVGGAGRGDCHPRARWSATSTSAPRSSPGSPSRRCEDRCSPPPSPSSCLRFSPTGSSPWPNAGWSRGAGPGGARPTSPSLLPAAP